MPRCACTIVTYHDDVVYHSVKQGLVVVLFLKTRSLNKIKQQTLKTTGNPWQKWTDNEGKFQLLLR